MKASLETSALFLSTTLELKNFVSPDLKFHCFLLPNFRSKDSSRSFRTIRKISRLSGNFPGYPETFRTIRKISGLSGDFPDHPAIFQTIWKLPSAISRVTRKNFPDAQKLSGWQCHDATMVFAPLQVGSEYVQSMFRVSSEYVQSMFRVCSG